MAEPLPPAGPTPTLQDVVATSPARVTGRGVHVFPVTGPAALEEGDLAMIRDDVEVTMVTSSVGRLEEARSHGRAVEGPFSVIRLEISLSFGAPGFIATATTACSDAGINVFLLSTFSFDYLLVPAADEAAALRALGAAGFPVP